MIERLLTPGSIPGLDMRRCVFRKDTSQLFSTWPKNLPVMVAQAIERPANRTYKGRCALVKQARLVSCA